ncbi:hypothetical protein APA_2638 [Pseudanabaena sp. lw0831]|nr:hypothetical protein APA_2638 [Pseudanabaena sp. lw0831]
MLFICFTELLGMRQFLVARLRRATKNCFFIFILILVFLRVLI